MEISNDFVSEESQQTAKLTEVTEKSLWKCADGINCIGTSRIRCDKSESLAASYSVRISGTQRAAMCWWRHPMEWWWRAVQHFSMK